MSMTTYVPADGNGVTWRFKTLYARHLQLSRLEVMEELDPGHPELQRLKMESSRKVSNSSSRSSTTTGTFSKRARAHMSLKTVGSGSTPTLDNISFGGLSHGTSPATSDYFQSSTGPSENMANPPLLRTKRIDFEELEAELLPSA